MDLAIFPPQFSSIRVGNLSAQGSVDGSAEAIQQAIILLLTEAGSILANPDLGGSLASRVRNASSDKDQQIACAIAIDSVMKTLNGSRNKSGRIYVKSMALRSIERVGNQITVNIDLRLSNDTVVSRPLEV